MHQYAKDAAAAALAADSMGKFWEFHEALYKTKKYDDKSLREMANGFGLDPDEFERKMKSKEILNRINRDKMDGQKARVSGTPAIFINGRLLMNRNLNGFQEMIDAQLKNKKQFIGIFLHYEYTKGAAVS